MTASSQLRLIGSAQGDDARAGGVLAVGLVPAWSASIYSLVRPTPCGGAR